MTILAPADATEMSRMMPLTVDYPGPIYIRLAKGGDPIVTSEHTAFEIGKSYLIREGQDALLISTGVVLKRTLDAAELLRGKGLDVAVLHIPTVKPLDTEAILEYAARVPVIVTAEEHTVIGGLGSAVAEVLAEASFSSFKSFKRIGIPDVFPDQYGSQDSLMARYNITPQIICETVERLYRKQCTNHGRNK
jgi:transketolase